MRFADIPTKIRNYRVAPSDASAAAPTPGPVLFVAPCRTRPGEFEVRLSNAFLFVKPVVDADIRRLNMELAAGSAVLAQLANPAADGSVELQVAYFAGDCLEMGAVEIAVDQYVEQTFAKIAPRKLSGAKLYETLTERCTFTQGNQTYFFILAGPSMDSLLASERHEDGKPSQEGEALDETAPDEKEVEPPAEGEFSTRLEPTHKNSFCITGSGLRFVATEAVRPDATTIYIATRLNNKIDPDRALRLARGKLSFADWSQTGQIQWLTKSQMSALAMDNDSYLRRWDEFVSVEGELLLLKARKIGALLYGDAVANRDGTITVHIAQAPDSALAALADGEVDSLEAVDDLPEYLKDPDLTFADFAGVIERNAEEEALRGKVKRRKDTAPRYDVSNYDAQAKLLTLKTELLPPSGTLILSLAGDVAQIKRRLFARKAILEGRTANPQLGLLIEEKGVIAPTRPPVKVEPLSAHVSNKVFHNPPTERQRDAIAVALNTPDIALIQGPPGTGKTTVIAAIIERLSEMSDERGASSKGSVLLTGLQHDAVENMIDRVTLHGLPVPKFGKSSASDEDGFSAFERKLQARCVEWAAALRAKNPQLIEIEQEAQVKNLCLQYLSAPTRSLARSIAERIAGFSIQVLGEACSRRAAHLAERLAAEGELNGEINPLIESVRRLRHRPESFADDGPERAADALDDLDDVLSHDERILLDRASLWGHEDGVPPFLDEIAALKKRLLARFTAPPVFRVEKQNDEIVALMEETIKRLRVAGFSAKDAKSAALAEFLAELESNPYGMADAISDYAYAFAATCQQSVNKGMLRQKGLWTDDPAQQIRKIEYDYVIVDEAARITPPDLMIAMAQGKRIILVGDHRQLPHMIDEAVGEQMESGETGKEESEWLKKSMFQYLFGERLKTLEQDGISRRVTLDAQYRMHPLLGDFVSRNFYERFDPSERFSSGRQESDFAQNLHGTGGVPAVWLEVPAAKGRHGKNGNSWIRRAEASAIAQQLSVWMSSAEGRDLSFGVISFYKAQAQLIQRQLGALTEDPKKLRIGTVDSFQGMEFDVVILSMVRTMPDNWKPRSNDEIEQARSLFGHLCLYNRLNVSMSRQKKLLVVAGDSGLLQSDLAGRHIPGLVDFYQMCRRHGKVLPCQ